MSWTQLGQDINGDAGGDGLSATALSSDGLTVAYGSPGNKYIRVKRYINGSWTSLGNKITGTGEFGKMYVSLSSDGNTVATGASAFSTSAAGKYAAVYRYNTSTNVWDQLGSNLTGTGALFGFSVKLSEDGNTIAVGSKDSCVEVFEYNSSTSSWVQKGSDILPPPNHPEFGYVVDLTADGNTVAVNGRQNGSVFTYSNNAWSLKGASIDTGIAYGTTGTAISDDGNIVAFGANGDCSVRVYSFANNTWSQLGSTIYGTSGTQFGVRVRISSDGSIVAIGSTASDINGTDRGHVGVYEYVNNDWSQLGSDIVGEANGDTSGILGLSNNGKIVSISAPGNDGGGSNSGHVRVFSFPAGDNTAPTITLLGDATVNVQYNTTYTDAGATATDDTDGDITSSIITTSTVNTSTIGAYSVKYNATDAAGNVATEVIRVVNVVDLTKPTITLTGSSTVTTSIGRTYTDAGATATDNVDGNLTNSITSVSTVDMTTAGTYSITFNVTDAAGNTAVPAVRTIIVEDNVPVLSTDTDTVNTISSTSISTQDLTSAAVVGNSAAEKREYTKNAVINMFAKNANALSGKKLVLQAGAVLPGFSESLAEDTILIDGRVSATLNKLDFINKSFYIPMEVNSVVSLDSFNDTVTITQNENDFTIATSTLTTTKVAGDSFSYDHLNIMLGSVYGSLSAPIICFKEGTKITCLDVKTNQDIELPIETIPPNTYVKTYKHGYIQVKKITNHKLENPDSREILKGRLYIYEPCETTPGLYEPLIMTGCHSALVDSITPEQQQLMEEQVGNTFITDDKYRLMCMYDTRAEPYTVSGIYTIWHICLEHYDEEMNYGIYANGLLVESCSKKNIELMVDTPEPA